MKAIILQENLQKALSIVARISTSSGQLPILNTVLIKAARGELNFSTTNLELSINYWNGAKIDQEGRVVVPIKQLLEAVSSFPPEKVKIDVSGNQLRVGGKGSEVKINTMPADEFPQIPSVKKARKGSDEVSFDLKELTDCVSKVSFAASADESRAVLTGMMLVGAGGGVRAVSTDGYRLSSYDLKKTTLALDKDKSIIIPARAFNELLRVATDEDEKIKLVLSEKENQAIFSFSSGEIVSRLIEGDFPDYESIIPDERKATIRVDREELERAVKLAAIFAREAANIVRFRLEGGLLHIEANAAEVGQGSTQLDTEYKGPKQQIAFNYRFLSDVLGCIKSQNIEIQILDGLKPGLFLEEANPSFLHLIMPVRIQEN